MRSGRNKVGSSRERERAGERDKGLWVGEYKLGGRKSGIAG
jgi:hypothetical protein